jgi:hypothetical protein
MLPSGDGVLVGEDRYEEGKQALFFCLDLRTGKPLWERKKLEESWWVGIEAIRADAVYIHEFARPDLPEHSGIICLSARSGELLWLRKELQFRGFAGDAVVARQRGSLEDSFFLLDRRTGETLQKLNEEEVSGIDIGGSEEDGRVLYPSPVDRDGPRWPGIAAALDGREIAGDCEMIEVEGRTIICYHAFQNGDAATPVLDHRLVVLDAAGRTIFDDLLHDNAHMPVYDSFFVLGGLLYYIRKERQVVCLDIAAAARS